jgi:hypothetical protein
MGKMSFSFRLLPPLPIIIILIGLGASIVLIDEIGRRLSSGEELSSQDIYSSTALNAAQEDLSRTLGVATREIEVVKWGKVNWGDTSLGCPQPGMAYPQVVTPGFLIVLSVRGGEYEYHTNFTDKKESLRLVSCPQKP